jgi:hypothetical protein
MKNTFCWIILTALAACNGRITESDRLLEDLMKSRPEAFEHILENPDSLEIQIIYTQINRDNQNNPSFRTFYFNTDSTRYFYPASTVKLPMALLALEYLNELGIKGLSKETPMFHDSAYSGQLSVTSDTTSATGLPSVAHYVKKILVVSDNDAHNRLYELLGQRETNVRLQAKGYDVRFLHRLERALSPDENRHTEAVTFRNGSNVVFHQPMQVSTDSIEAPKREFKGRGFYRGDSLIHEPFDFTYKNAYPLTAQHRLLRALLFPETVAPSARFQLSEEDYRFVYQYMSQLPAETAYPPYYRDTANYYDAYCKFLLYGAQREPMPEYIRIFNKVGDAYGYLIDNAYVVDFKNQVEFMLSAVILCNSDGVFNDGEYDYQSLGYPFMKNLGEVVYEYEMKRERTVKPDLSRFKLTYELPQP